VSVFEVPLYDISFQMCPFSGVPMYDKVFRVVRFRVSLCDVGFQGYQFSKKGGGALLDADVEGVNLRLFHCKIQVLR
jgi:hypothetical protein